MRHKFCLSCNEELVGRTDKKFCDSQCRATFHNRNKPAHEHYILEMNGVLRKNRSILASLSPEGKTTIRISVVKSMEFSRYNEVEAREFIKRFKKTMMVIDAQNSFSN